MRDIRLGLRLIEKHGSHNCYDILQIAEVTPHINCCNNFFSPGTFFSAFIDSGTKIRVSRSAWSMERRRSAAIRLTTLFTSTLALPEILILMERESSMISSMARSEAIARICSISISVFTSSG